MFAPGFTRNEDGWILFPSDVQLRKQLFFPPEVSEHPAKMNLHLQQACIEYVAKEGEVIMDIFGGTGSLMIAALQGIRVVLLEIEDGYHQLEQRVVEELERQVPGAGSLVILIQGDAKLMLPIPCNHIITSPPYSSAMTVGKSTKRMKEDANDHFAKLDKQMQEYTKSPRNIGRMNPFIYNQTMEKVYQLCYQSILPGGTLTIILKDRIEDQERVGLTGWADKVCQRCGFSPVLWERWKTPTIAFTKINKSHGLTVVEDESIMIYRRP